ncbi:MAG TPA: glycosyltransferase family 4 protein [Anaerolineae bacterium]
MRIALVAPFGLRAKGTARARALPLARALARRGHTTGLFVPPYDSPADSGCCRRDGEVPVFNVALPFGRPGGALWHLRLAWRLLAAVQHFHPDVIHVFKPKGPSGLVGLAGMAPWRQAAVVVDADDWEGPGGWNDDPRAGYTAAQRLAFAWQERYGLGHADAWTVASACLRGRALAFGADPGGVMLLPNGIGDERIWLAEPEGPPRPDPDPDAVLLYTRFAGVSAADVAEIWGRVVAARPTARLTIVGQGLGGEELDLARRLPGVRVAGWLEPEAMPATFAGHAAAIVPWRDTPPNRARSSAKVLELMAAGLPLVAYAVGALPETLGKTGLLVPPDDAGAFAAALCGLLADPARGRGLGEAARRRVQTVYTWENLAPAALAAYEIARGRRRNNYEDFSL